MLDKIPLEIAKWILMIPAAIAMFGGLAGIACVDLYNESRRHHPAPPDTEALWFAIAVVANLMVIVAWILLVRARSGTKCLGYSRGFWMALLVACHTSGMALGFFATR